MSICSCYCCLFGGIYDTTEKLGLGQQLGVRLSRKTLTANGLRLYGMHTNDLLDLKMKTLRQRYFRMYEFLHKIQFFTGEYSMISLSGPTFIFVVLKEN